MRFHGQPQGLSVRFFQFVADDAHIVTMNYFSLFALGELVRRGRRTLRILSKPCIFFGTPRAAFPTGNRYFSTNSILQADGRSKPRPTLYLLPFSSPVTQKSEKTGDHAGSPLPACAAGTLHFFICFQAGATCSPLRLCRWLLLICR